MYISEWFVFSLLGRRRCRSVKEEKESAGVKQRKRLKNGWDRNSRGQLFWLIGGGLSLFSCLIYMCVCVLENCARAIQTLVPPQLFALSRWLRSHVEFIVDDSFPATLPDRSPASSPLCFIRFTVPGPSSLISTIDHVFARQPRLVLERMVSCDEIEPTFYLVCAWLSNFDWVDTQQDVLNQLSWLVLASVDSLNGLLIVRAFFFIEREEKTKTTLSALFF